MEGSTDRGLFGFGHKKDEEKPTHHHEQQHGTQQGPGTYEGQHQQMRPEHAGDTNPMTGTYSAAPGILPAKQTEEGEGKKHGFMGKVEDTLGIDKLKKKTGKKTGKKSGGDGSSSSSSDEEDNAGKKKHGIF